jgi:hypothetical protein
MSSRRGWFFCDLSGVGALLAHLSCFALVVSSLGVDCRKDGGDPGRSQQSMDASTRLPNLPGLEASPIVVVQVEGREESPKVIFAAWADGLVVWSKDDLNGGPPYYRAKIDPKQAREQVKGVEVQIASLKPSSRRHRGLDSSFTAICLRTQNQVLQMESWHELAEVDSGLVATAKGLEPLDGRSRDAVLEAENSEYRDFRKTWAASRTVLRGLIPSQGQPMPDAEFLSQPVSATGPA